MSFRILSDGDSEGAGRICDEHVAYVSFVSEWTHPEGHTEANLVRIEWSVLLVRIGIRPVQNMPPSHRTSMEPVSIAHFSIEDVI